MEAVVVGIVPGVVEVMKRAGMPSRYAGIAAVGVAIVLVALGDLAVRGDAAGSAAGWVLRGTVAGLAAAGLYSQVSRVVEPPRRSGRM